MSRYDLCQVKTVTEIVNEFLDRNTIRPSKLARLTGTTQQNISKKLAKNDMDTDWVKRISDAVNHNFFKDLSNEYERSKNKERSIDSIVEEPVVKYGKHPLEEYIEEIIERKLRNANSLKTK